jgi:hypothetical protein
MGTIVSNKFLAETTKPLPRFFFFGIVYVIKNNKNGKLIKQVKQYIYCRVDSRKAMRYKLRVRAGTTAFIYSKYRTIT